MLKATLVYLHAVGNMILRLVTLAPDVGNQIKV